MLPISKVKLRLCLPCLPDDARRKPRQAQPLRAGKWRKRGNSKHKCRQFGVAEPDTAFRSPKCTADCWLWSRKMMTNVCPPRLKAALEEESFSPPYFCWEDWVPASMEFLSVSLEADIKECCHLGVSCWPKQLTSLSTACMFNAGVGKLSGGAFLQLCGVFDFRWPENLFGKAFPFIGTKVCKANHCIIQNCIFTSSALTHNEIRMSVCETQKVLSPAGYFGAVPAGHVYTCGDEVPSGRVRCAAESRHVIVTIPLPMWKQTCTRCVRSAGRPGALLTLSHPLAGYWSAVPNDSGSEAK